jgi:hypothetical protein
VQNTSCHRRIIPARRTIDDLEREVSQCEKQAAQSPEPEASELKKKAELLRQWIASLKRGKWHS